MSNQIFKTKRIGIMGNKPLGAEYMAEVNERARRMNAATKEEAADQRQFKLPFPCLSVQQLKLPFIKR